MPAYNEEGSIAIAVANVKRALESYTVDSELIVVDDGSTDATGARLDEMEGAGLLTTVRLARNHGYGHALRAGFAVATRPLVFFTDADDQFDAADLGRLLPLIETADIVVGEREDRCDGWGRRALSTGYNWLVRQLLDAPVNDVNCAFKLIRRDALGHLALASNGYAINAEMMARAGELGLAVRSVPIRHRPRRAGFSKVGVWDVPRSLAEILFLANRRGLASNR